MAPHFSPISCIKIQLELGASFLSSFFSSSAPLAQKIAIRSLQTETLRFIAASRILSGFGRKSPDIFVSTELAETRRHRSTAADFCTQARALHRPCPPLHQFVKGSESRSLPLSVPLDEDMSPLLRDWWVSRQTSRLAS